MAFTYIIKKISKTRRFVTHLHKKKQNTLVKILDLKTRFRSRKFNPRLASYPSKTWRGARFLENNQGLGMVSVVVTNPEVTEKGNK